MGTDAAAAMVATTAATAVMAAITGMATIAATVIMGGVGLTSASESASALITPLTATPPTPTLP